MRDGGQQSGDAERTLQPGGSVIADPTKLDIASRGYVNVAVRERVSRVSDAEPRMEGEPAAGNPDTCERPVLRLV